MNIMPNFSPRHASEDNKVAKSDQRDRLSELPDSLIFVILSFLQMRDVVRTTFLSKRWRNLWTTVSYLDFWYHEYDLDEYRSFIYGALAQWKGLKIHKFRISFSVFYPTAIDLDSWLLFAIENQSEELSILLGRFRDSYSDYYPPQRLYSCSWITKLSLSYCKLKIHENVQWNQLKSLTIEGSSTLSEDAMNRILLGAPLLEELNLFITKIVENFYIRSTRLKILRFGTDDYCFGTASVRSVLRIWAPNLTTLEFTGRIYGNFLLYAPCLINAVLYLLDFGYRRDPNFSPYKMLHRVFLSISHAKNVTLSKWCIKFLLHMKNDGMVVRFSNAKFLHLSTGEETGKMLVVLQMFPNLRTLIAKLDFPRDGYTFESETTPSLLHLKTVDITWSLYYPSIFPMIEILLKNGLVLEEMVLRLRHHEANPEVFVSGLEKVLSMPRSSPRAKVIICRD